MHIEVTSSSFTIVDAKPGDTYAIDYGMGLKYHYEVFAELPDQYKLDAYQEQLFYPYERQEDGFFHVMVRAETYDMEGITHLKLDVGPVL